MKNIAVHKTLILLISFSLSLLLSFDGHSAEVEKGQLAPDFSIKRFDGTTFTLSDYKHKKAVYLVFWTTWCTYCLKKIPKLQQAAKILHDQIEIIAIDTSEKDTFAKALKFQKERNIQYPLAFDFGKKVTDLYGVWGTPTEFIIDINGVVIHRDSVPDNLAEHLSNWNMIDHRAKQRRLVAREQCDQENKVC
jgi:peroxiredoxin